MSLKGGDKVGKVGDRAISSPGRSQDDQRERRKHRGLAFMFLSCSYIAMPESSRHVAIMLGLASLYEHSDRAQEGPLAPSVELRALLALLHVLSDGDRRSFDGFWREAMAEGSSAYHPAAAGYMRGTSMRIEIQGIGRALGLEPQAIEFGAAISRLRCKSGNR